MHTTLPKHLIDLVKANPLKNDDETARVLSGDIELGVKAYRKTAAQHGSSGDWWLIHRELRLLAGMSVEDACRGMHSKELHWFSDWAFNAGFLDEGISAQRMVHAMADRPAACRLGDVRFLDALIRTGRPEEVLSAVDKTIGSEEPEDFPDQERHAARALIALERPEDAAKRLRRVLERHHDDGYLWAQLAIAYTKLGKTTERQRALQEAAKLGIYRPYNEPRLRDQLLSELNITDEAWEQLHAPFATSNLDMDERSAEWARNPGACFRPTKEATPHKYGGDTFQTPPCRGCGHPIHQAFVMDIRACAGLAKVLPDWTLLPLLFCTDCSVLLGRHDYEVDLQKLSVSLVNVAINAREFGKPHGTFPKIPQQTVALVPIPLNLSADGLRAFGDIGTSVGGNPVWVQDSLRVFCRTCRQEMVYVASLCDTESLEPRLHIVDGFLYHFACNQCRTLSVISQFT